MGCAPSSEEKEMWNSRDKNREANTLYQSSSRKINQFQALLAKLKTEFQKNNLICNELNKITINVNKPKFEALPQESDPDNFYSYLSELGSTADKNFSLAKQTELALCNAQSALYLIYDKHLDLSNSKYFAEIKAMIVDYEAHRKDDINSWITWLNSQKSSAQTTLDYGEKINFSKALRLIKKIDEEVKRVQALTEKEILLSNTLFARNPEEFDSVSNIYK